MTTYVKQSTIANAGLGVFVNRAFCVGDIIAKSPFIVSCNTPDDIISHAFAGITPDNNYIVFGHCSLTNHSTTRANTTLRFSVDERFIEFLATTDIEPHQELLMNYGEDTVF